MFKSDFLLFDFFKFFAFEPVILDQLIWHIFWSNFSVYFAISLFKKFDMSLCFSFSTFPAKYYIFCSSVYVVGSSWNRWATKILNIFVHSCFPGFFNSYFPVLMDEQKNSYFPILYFELFCHFCHKIFTFISECLFQKWVWYLFIFFIC